MTSLSKSLVSAFATMLLAVAGSGHGETPAATQPAPASIAKLINQLGSDNSDDRDAAQQRLQALGMPAVPQLQNAADKNDDPEIRSRAAAVLSALRDRSVADGSLLTLHCAQSTPQDVFDAITKQQNAQVMAMGMAVPVPGKPIRSVTLDVDGKPFWETMVEVSRQLKVCPMADTAAHQLRLCPVDRNWMADAPHQIVGPFFIGVESISRQRTIDLAGPQTQNDHMTLRMNFCAEPKLWVTHVSDFLVKEAVDDSGNSLMPRPRPLGFPQTELRRALGSDHVVEVVLPYPQQHPGATLKTLRGEFSVIVATDFQQYEQDDVLSTPKVSNTFSGADIKATVTQKDGNFLVSIQCDLGSLDRKQWSTITNCFGQVSLSDKSGNRLNTLSPVTIHSMSDSHFTATGSFSGKIAAGESLRLDWSFPTSFKPVTVPVTFSDLPMP